MVNAPSPPIAAAPTAPTTPENPVARRMYPQRRSNALERVMAAASKRTDATAAATTQATPPALAGLEDVISRAMPAVVRVETSSGSQWLLHHIRYDPDQRPRRRRQFDGDDRRLGGNTLTARRPDDRAGARYCGTPDRQSDASQATLPIDSSAQPRQADVIALAPARLQTRHARNRQRRAHSRRPDAGAADAAINPATAAPAARSVRQW